MGGRDLKHKKDSALFFERASSPKRGGFLCEVGDFYSRQLKNESILLISIDKCFTWVFCTLWVFCCVKKATNSNFGFQAGSFISNILVSSRT